MAAANLQRIQPRSPTGWDIEGDDQFIQPPFTAGPDIPAFLEEHSGFLPIIQTIGVQTQIISAG